MSALRVCVVLTVAALLAACAAPQLAGPAPSSPLAATSPTSPPPTITAGTTATTTAAPTPTLVAPASPTALSALSGAILIDGSSTVFPITEAAATAFRTIAPGVTITLGVSGTGGGFRRFCAGETTISDASRPIKADEAATCAKNGIAFVELPVAYDGLSLVVNGANTWAQCLTTGELRRIWEPASTGRMLTWRDVRPEWPARPMTLYGAGTDSGTFDYFTAAIVGAEGLIRPDYTASEDDYLLAQDLVGDPGGLGFFGYAYLVEYARDLRAVAIDSGAGCVVPSETTIASGAYQPLSRPIFIYVRDDHLARAEVAAFVSFYLANGPLLVRSARYIPLPPRAYKLAARRAHERIVGSVFEGAIPVGISIEQLLALEGNN